jgi:glycosyltransferase involved in cell wall biosynthesis
VDDRIGRRAARAGAGAAARFANLNVRIGWVSSDTLTARVANFASLSPAVAMRIANIARWIEKHVPGVETEMYRRDRRYDIVVFAKAMDEECRREAEKIQSYGGRVVFDANVNYYEIWGDYDIPDTKPTEQQRRDAVAMTQVADWVVADSSYLLGVVQRYTKSAGWIPDNVDLGLFGARRQDRGADRIRLVWSGMAKKARPLLSIREALATLPDAELVVVSEAAPAELAELEQSIPCRYVPFTPRRYAKTLRTCDVIISPKRLTNAYELAHTEWKITLGMAAGLPAVASPQQSYVEAIGHKGGGIVADGTDEWAEALGSLASDADLRARLGSLARETVVERYATPVVAAEYAEVLGRLN